MAGKRYDDIDPNLLRTLPNPGEAMELTHKAPEVAFLGAQVSPGLRDAVRDVLSRRKVIEPVPPRCRV